jgi:hypothetical protein
MADQKISALGAHLASAMGATDLIHVVVTGSTNKKMTVTEFRKFFVSYNDITSQLEPTATANYGLLSMGGGEWDGATGNFFTGHASGTFIAVNAASGFAGNLVHLAIDDADRFMVNSAGQAYWAGSNGYIGINNSISIDAALRSVRTAVGSSALNISTTQVAIGATSLDASAIFGIVSTTKGFLPPVMGGVAADAISTPANGLMLYCNDTAGTTVNAVGFWYYKGGTWTAL